MIRPEKSLTVVVVDEEFPYPANSGKRIRTLNLLEHLAPLHQIIFVAHRNADPRESRVAKQHLESVGIQTVEIPRRVPPKSGLFFYARLAANLFSSLPYSVASHVSPEMQKTLKELAKQNEVQVWHCEWTPYTEFFRSFAAEPLVVAAHNVESLIWQRYVESESNPVKRWYIRRQWKKFERFERWAFGRATQMIMVSENDAMLAKTSFDAPNTCVVQNGVDVERYRSTGIKRSPKNMIFLGSLDWRPNLDGISQFLKTAFPKIVALEPDATLTIVGRNPPKWLVEQARLQANIVLHANVPDVVPYLADAGMMVVPLRIGGGSRLKIIEAAANALPVVSTRIGAEGLSFKPGIDYFVADDIERMVDPVLQVMQDKHACESATRSARQLAEQNYDWSTLAQLQSSIWQTVAGVNDPSTIS